MYSTFTSRNEVFNPEEQLAELFQTRKGVCSHYVLLFYTLCQKQIIIEASTRIYKERLFLQHYFETPVKKRKMLFLAGYKE